MAPKSFGGGNIKGIRRSMADVEQDAYTTDEGLQSVSGRDLEASDNMLSRAADAIASSAQARSNFVSAMSRLGNDANPQEVEAVRAVLDFLSPSQRESLIADAGSPAGLMQAYASGADASFAGPTDPGAQSAFEAEPAPAKASKNPRYVAEGDLKRANFASKQDPLDRPGTYGKNFSKAVERSLEQRSGAMRYGSKPGDQLRPWEERQVLWQSNPDLFIARRDYQEPLLRGLTVGDANIGTLTPEQIAMLSGITPDQITPEVMQAIYGQQLTDDVIKSLGYKQRSALVGEPQLTPAQIASMSNRTAGEDLGMDVRTSSSAKKKLEMLVNMAASGDPQATVNLDEVLPFWAAPSPHWNRDTGGLAYSQNANSGELLARWIRTGGRWDDPQFVNLVAPLLDRSIAQQAPLARKPTGFREGYTSALDFAQDPLKPGRNGEIYLRRAAEQGMPFEQYSNVRMNREGPQAAPSLRDVLLDGLRDTSAQADQTITTPDAPQITPSSGDTSYLSPAMLRNPNVLAALLA
jgi:hypothetical protein